MGMGDERGQHQYQPQLASLSKENLLVLDRDLLRASVKARYFSSLRDPQDKQDDVEDEAAEIGSRRLEGDDEGRFAVASLKSSTVGRSQSKQPPPVSRTRQRRIKVGA